MRAAGFDLSSHVGWAVWDGNSPAPLLGPKRVLYWDRDLGMMMEHWRLWLGQFFDEHNPEIVGVEGPAQNRTFTDTNTTDRQACIRGMLHWACLKKQVPIFTYPPATWRKSFIGYGSKRAKPGEAKVDWKVLAKRRCRGLGWDFQEDHNIAEAAGVLNHLLTHDVPGEHRPPWAGVPALTLPLELFS